MLELCPMLDWLLPLMEALAGLEYGVQNVLNHVPNYDQMWFIHNTLVSILKEIFCDICIYSFYTCINIIVFFLLFYLFYTHDSKPFPSDMFCN